MIHIPILRHGVPYKSLDVIRIPHHRTKETFAEMSQANGGIIRRDAGFLGEVNIECYRPCTGCGQVIYQTGAAALTAVGLMSLLLTSRLTRGEEDSGRLELIRAAPVGRDAPLAAAVLVVAAANVVTGVATTLILLAEGLPVACW